MRAAPHPHRLAGIAFLLAAMAILPVMDGLVKHLGQTLPVLSGARAPLRHPGAPPSPRRPSVTPAKAGVH